MTNQTLWFQASYDALGQCDLLAEVRVQAEQIFSGFGVIVIAAQKHRDIIGKIERAVDEVFGEPKWRNDASFVFDLREGRGPGLRRRS